MEKCPECGSDKYIVVTKGRWLCCQCGYGEISAPHDFCKNCHDREERLTRFKIARGGYIELFACVCTGLQSGI